MSNHITSKKTELQSSLSNSFMLKLEGYKDSMSHLNQFYISMFGKFSLFSTSRKYRGVGVCCKLI